jgi:2-iminobutanoate/2-iminopropanoate deaminase
MGKKCINVESMPKAGPYSHAVEAGGFLFLSGMVPVDTEKNESIKDDIRKATARVLENIRMILHEAGSDLDKVVKASVFLKDMADFKAMNEVYATYFSENQPVRTCVAVRELPGDFQVEIDVIAIK